MPTPNGAAIKAIRLAKRLTGTEVAKACNISHGHLFNIESPLTRKQASDELLTKLAAKLDVPIEAIVVPQPQPHSRRSAKQAA